MGLARQALLALSHSRRLSRWATSSPLVRRSVSRFMPGERLEDALLAADELDAEGIHSILTRLGENVASLDEARAVADHYLTLIDAVAARRLKGCASVKPSQLGLDLDDTVCLEHLVRVGTHAASCGQILWVDMEGSAYVDRTFQLVRALHDRAIPVGVAVQAYLHRSPADLDSSIAPSTAIRIVKGAYLEPPDVAIRAKREVDDRYFSLATRLLERSAAHGGPVVHLATHDEVLIERLTDFIAERRIPGSVYEYAMLYGIRPSLQRRLVAVGHRVSVLISYGPHWFPWYMRRLAERPANVWFVLRSMAD